MDDLILTFRTLAAVGFLLLLILLRLDSERFGTAEYDERSRDGRPPSLLRRLAWYVVGLGLCTAIWHSRATTAESTPPLNPTTNPRAPASSARSRNQGGVCMPACAKGACGGSVLSVPMQTAGRWTTLQRSALALSS